MDVDEDSEPCASVGSASATTSAQSSVASTNSTLSVLLQAENVASQLRASVITSTNNNPGQELDASTSSGGEAASNSGSSAGQQQRVATISDLSEAIKQQLLLLVEWAKVLPPFFDLPLDDQVSLMIPICKSKIG